MTFCQKNTNNGASKRQLFALLKNSSFYLISMSLLSKRPAPVRQGATEAGRPMAGNAVRTPGLGLGVGHAGPVQSGVPLGIGVASSQGPAQLLPFVPVLGRLSVRNRPEVEAD